MPERIIEIVNNAACLHGNPIFVFIEPDNGYSRPWANAHLRRQFAHIIAAVIKNVQSVAAADKHGVFINLQKSVRKIAEIIIFFRRIHRKINELAAIENADAIISAHP